jgi:hypothetical protein
MNVSPTTPLEEEDWALLTPVVLVRVKIHLYSLDVRRVRAVRALATVARTTYAVLVAADVVALSPELIHDIPAGPGVGVDLPALAAAFTRCRADTVEVEVGLDGLQKGSQSSDRDLGELHVC